MCIIIIIFIVLDFRKFLNKMKLADLDIKKKNDEKIDLFVS